MLQSNVIEKDSGFRTLSNAELMAVCGGADIVVTGNTITVTGPRSGGLSGMDLIGLQNMQQASAIQMMIDMMEGTNEEFPDDDEWQPAGLFDSDTDDFKAFVENQFPDQENQIMVVGNIGDSKFAANIGPDGKGYLWAVTDNIFTSDTYQFVTYVENTRLGMNSGSSTSGSSALTLSMSSSDGGSISFELTQTSPGW
ncbi:hypothetical protein [Erythrobacter sp. KY5]|uniref:hypothetical protein n=1 Tax=Erythrobacter sp. KY5 TaxID=2011159 RepID=UPI0013A6A511|nr:hypothetical protein [Erythrobacter sp. KY5]